MSALFNDGPGDGYIGSLSRFVVSLKNQIEAIKRNRDWEAKFMLLEEMLKDERTEGRIEGRHEGKIDSILSILSSHGNIPEWVSRKIRSEKDSATLD